MWQQFTWQPYRLTVHCDPVTAKILGHFMLLTDDLAVLLFSTALEVSLGCS